MPTMKQPLRGPRSCPSLLCRGGVAVGGALQTGELISVFLDEDLHRHLHGLLERRLGLPIELLLDEPHRRDPQVRILIALAVVFLAGDVDRLAQRLARDLRVHLNHQVRKLLDLDIVARVAHVESVARRLVGVLYNLHDRLARVLDEAKGAVHLPTIYQH